MSQKMAAALLMALPLSVCVSLSQGARTAAGIGPADEVIEWKNDGLRSLSRSLSLLLVEMINVKR